MKQYKTVFLDWNKTLSYSKFWGHWQDTNHPNYAIYKNIHSELFVIPADLIKEWMRGGHTTEDVVHYIAKQTKQDYEMLLQEFIISCQTMEFSSPKIPELVTSLQSQGVKVIIATDNMDCFNRWTIPSLKLKELFDEIINSYYLGVLKSDIDQKGRSLFFKKSSKNELLKNSVLLDDTISLKTIMNNTQIDFIHVTQEIPLEKHLQKLLET